MHQRRSLLKLRHHDQGACPGSSLRWCGRDDPPQACQPGESPEVASRLRRDAAAMSRSFADLVTTLERRRDRTARQVIRVERVVVEAGGQTIVGAVGMAPAPAGGHP